jgi:hypothetical protein
MFVEMYERAGTALEGKSRVPNRATHFHENHLYKLDPEKFEFICEIDNLYFYEEITNARSQAR